MIVIAETRKLGVLGAHSLDHVALEIPDLDIASAFYGDFGLDVRKADGALDIYTFGHPHRWMRLIEGPSKSLQYISFGIFDDDLARFSEHFDNLGIAAKVGRDETCKSIWIKDPAGISVELRVAEKSSPDAKAVAALPPRGPRSAPMRDNIARVKPRRMSHAAIFVPELDRTVDFYVRALGLGLSDRSGPAAFLHGVHGSEHHMIAFGESARAGFHHCAWEVGSVDEVGQGAAQMASAGYSDGWGLGRHVLGSNYFFYVRDPWGSFSEYSFDMDYISMDMDWHYENADPQNSLYLWGPPVPTYFGINFEGERF